jgi:hypothetical protein
MCLHKIYAYSSVGVLLHIFPVVKKGLQVAIHMYSQIVKNIFQVKMSSQADEMNINKNI